jgi:hypothetical protein
MPKIDVKSAVRRAIDYLDEFEEFIPAHDVRLEETEYDEAGFWLITVSTIDETLGPIAALAHPRRNYRQFRIDAETGEIKSMKVRTLKPVE